MPHDTPLITTIVIGLCLAFVFGALAQRLRVSPLVGYLLAGILAGPYTPGFTADQHLIEQLAEIGIILLMFGVGLHFSLKDLLSVKAISVPGAIAQMTGATLLGFGLGLIMGWGTSGALIFGLSLSVASTVVLLRALQERRLIETNRGRIAVGWLIVEDLAMVLILVLLPALSLSTAPNEVAVTPHFTQTIWFVIGITIVKVMIFIALMLVVGRRVIPWLLKMMAQTASRELFSLAVLAIALGVAFGAAHLFGVSLALGAFFAGMIMRESDFAHRAAEETLPLRDAFAVLFFVSVGMLFDPMGLIYDFLPLMATLIIVIIGKSLISFFIVRLFRHPVGTALTISASLAQIGEFSFILAGLGFSLGLLPADARDIILGTALLSILLNPLVFWVADRLKNRLNRPKLSEISPETVSDITEPEEEKDGTSLPDNLNDHIVVIGYGRIGELVVNQLRERNDPVVIIEDEGRALEQLRDSHLSVIVGNAVENDVLQQAQLNKAKAIIITISNGFAAGQIVAAAKAANPALTIIGHAYEASQVDYLHHIGATKAIIDSYNIADALLVALDDVSDHKQEAHISDQPKTDDLTTPDTDRSITP